MSHAIRIPILALSRKIQFKGKACLLDYINMGPSNLNLVPNDITSVRCVDGITMSTTNNKDYLFREFYVHGGYQDDVFIALRNLLQPGDVFWDIGANYGFMSIYVFRWFKGHVATVAFEPNPSMATELRRNLQLNGCEEVKVETVCLSDRVGTAHFHISENNAANATLIPAFAEAHGQDIQIEVPTSTVDQCALRLAPPSVIKLDVEGSERLIIAGGQDYLKNHSVPIVAEYNVKAIVAAGLTPEGYLSMYSELGYHIYMLNRPLIGPYRWNSLHKVSRQSEIPILCNLVLIKS